MSDSPFRWNAVCIDCGVADVEAVIAFYVGLLGLELIEQEARWAMLRDPSGGMGINVQAEEWYAAPVWPERNGAAAKMMHFEVQVSDVAAAVVLAQSLGARLAESQPADRDPETLRVLLDPAGHPFCLWS